MTITVFLGVPRFLLSQIIIPEGGVAQTIVNKKESSSEQFGCWEKKRWRDGYSRKQEYSPKQFGCLTLVSEEEKSEVPNNLDYCHFEERGGLLRKRERERD